MLPKRKFRIISRRGLAAAALVAAALGVVPARAATPTVLYSFCAQSNASGICTDGDQPVAGLIADTAGNLFGTTQSGGANNSGTVFEIAKTASGFASTPSILYSFCTQPQTNGNCPDGAGPAAGLLADTAGNLFGTTQSGGANGQGTINVVPEFRHQPGN